MNCPICENPENRPVLVEGKIVFQCVFGVGLLECQSCGFVFADFIHPQVIDYYYTYICRHDLTDDTWTDLKTQSKENGVSQLETIRPFLPERLGKVLDFGGGNGEAARLYLPLADEVHVSENDPRSIDQIREEPRLSVIDPERLSADEFIGYFDLVVLSNVLEHMTFPVRRLTEISRILAPDGFLFVEIPNEAKVVKRNGKHAVQHIGFYSLETFEDLVRRQGSFEIVELRTCGAPVEEIIEKRQIIHAFDRLDTPDGWVIRALLKNSSPKIDIPPIEMGLEDGRKALEDLSGYLLRLANDDFSLNL